MRGSESPVARRRHAPSAEHTGRDRRCRRPAVVSNTSICFLRRHPTCGLYFGNLGRPAASVKLRGCPLPTRSVDRTRRCLVRQLPDGVANPVPGRRAVGIAVGRRLVGARGVFLKRLLAVALDHQAGGAPDIDLGHHARKPHAYDVSTLITKACGLGKCACQGSRGRGGRGRSGRMALILTAEDVVPRITA
jgi:hypothetical protein